MIFCTAQPLQQPPENANSGRDRSRPPLFSVRRRENAAVALDSKCGIARGDVAEVQKKQAE